MKYNNYRARLKERFKSQLIAADCDCEQAFNIIKKSKQNIKGNCQLNDESIKNAQNKMAIFYEKMVVHTY